MTKIELRQLPALTMAHVKIIGRFDEIGSAYENLMSWAGPQGLTEVPSAVVMTLYHADPKVTGIDKVEQSASISVSDDQQVPKGIEKMDFPGGKYAIGRFRIPSAGFENAWKEVCDWVAANGHNFTDGISCERYYNDHEKDPQKLHDVEICVPVD